MWGTEELRTRRTSQQESPVFKGDSSLHAHAADCSRDDESLYLGGAFEDRVDDLDSPPRVGQCADLRLFRAILWISPADCGLSGEK